MSLGIQNNYYSESSMVSAIRKQEAGNVKETFTKQLYFNEVDKAQETKVMTPEEEMEVFKKEFYAELERIPKNRTIKICITKISTFLILCDLAVCLATLYVSFSLVFALMRYLQGKVFLIRFYSPTTLSSSRAEFRLPSRLACA